MSRWSSLKSAASGVVVFTHTLCTIYVVSQYGVFFSKVSGPSMFPTFSGQGDVVVVDALSKWRGIIRPGDVVICSRPVDPKENIIKRVTAVGDQYVVVYPDRDHTHVRRVLVPPGHMWIEGDNPAHSLDSRQYGPVPLALVKGVVVAQVWPRFRFMWDTSSGLHR
ncbi:hypothetical protein FOA52_003447 [Chlamydomonas sp. UWO 241]|nr:hypothetical protein FOA52_003447 [Chlamydomonas sp. UWO 241]